MVASIAFTYNDHHVENEHQGDEASQELSNPQETGLPS